MNEQEFAKRIFDAAKVKADSVPLLSWHEFVTLAQRENEGKPLTDYERQRWAATYEMVRTKNAQDYPDIDWSMNEPQPAHKPEFE